MKQIKRISAVIGLLSASLLMQGQNGTSYTKSRNYTAERTYIDTAAQAKYVSDIVYTDGFGREWQRIQVGASPANGADLITPYAYGTLGKVEREYLPFAKSGNNGAFDADMYLPERWSSYGVEEQAYAFTETAYEASPLMRTASVTGAGKAWHTAGKSTATEYGTNADGEVKLYRVAADGTLTASGSYAAGTLETTATTDEDGHRTCSYTDAEGRTVLAVAYDGEERMETYYVYDGLGRLCHVLPPEASHQLATQEGAIDATVLKRLAYSYTYDRLDRMVVKQLPGCEPVYMVYDKYNRMVLSQDGVQRASDAKKWSYSVYDYNDRAVESGELVLAAAMTHAQLQEAAWDVEGYLPTGTRTPLQYTAYDGYTDKDPVTIHPFVAATGYDGTHSPNASGQVTAIKTRLLGTDKWMTETTYYDGYARPIQTVAGHPEKGLRYTRTRYDFTGNVLKRQETLGGGNTLETAYTYDERGRVLSKATTWNGKTSDRLEYIYNEVGQLTGKSYNGKTDETLTYNIRGWLTGIGSPAFRQTLHYTDGNGAPCYNGNISSLLWKAGSETTERGYTFTYDGLSRLKNAAYGEGNALTGNANRFTEQVTGYDRQGNILGLKRYGQTSTSGYGLTDDLTFSYDGNRLKAVSDAVTTAAYNNGFEFRDGAKADVEYEYDENGNLTKDLNKNISEIQYNCLNLPSRVTFGDGSTVSYLYDASGAKLQTVHTIGGTAITADYFGSEVYENGTLVRVLTEDGYVSAGDGKFHYFLQDHQGNNRVVLSQEGTVEEVNHYYPFGGLFATASSVQPYKYNGKELDTKAGLDWHDYGARQYDAALGRWHVVDPMAEKYFRESPYGYCGNNPVVFIDPNGMDYWSTSNPSEIRRFMDVMINNNFGDIKSFDYSSWNHSTDADFLAKLTFNDKKNVLYYNYGTFIDGELTSVGITFPVLRNDINSTTVEPFSFLDYTDFVLSQSSIMVYSEEMGRWLGKNGKFYDFKFNGNQHTGGRLKFAKNLSRKLDKTSKIIGGVQVTMSWIEYGKENYSLAQSLMDTGFGVFGILNKTYGTWTGIWYELGKEYGLIHKYMKHKNVE